MQAAGAGGRAAGGAIRIVQRDWRAEDLDEAAITVAALEGKAAVEFAAAARACGVPVNVVDTPDISTFSFGTIVNRSPVVVGISTAGVAPVLGQSIRAKIRRCITLSPRGVKAAARSLNARWAMGPDRRDAWRRFADRALGARKAPTIAELGTLLVHAPAKGGSVALVGAGPGDPELLTLKALRALQSADVILYDRLVKWAEILELARREGQAHAGRQVRQRSLVPAGRDQRADAEAGA